MMKELIESTVWIVPSADGTEYHALNHMGVIVKRAKLQVFLVQDKELQAKYKSIAIVVSKRIPHRHNHTRRHKPWQAWEG